MGRRLSRPGARLINGVVRGVVVANDDPAGLARVRVRIPALGEGEQWALVATPMAGRRCGVLFLPQVDDQVVIAFEQGDPNEPIVVGSTWSAWARPPDPPDPRTRRSITSPAGHSIALDDAEGSVSVTSADGHEVRITAEGIDLSASGSASRIRLSADGRVAIEASHSITLTAPHVAAEAAGQVELSSSGEARLGAGGHCRIYGAVVTIN
jgi:uncharacterized protein involved in type VI secretion and phage assembly